MRLSTFTRVAGERAFKKEIIFKLYTYIPVGEAISLPFFCCTDFVRFNVTAVGRGLGPAAETMRRIVRENGFCYKFAVGEGLAPPAAETMRHIVRYSGRPATSRSASHVVPYGYAASYPTPPPKRSGVSFGKRRREQAPALRRRRRIAAAYRSGNDGGSKPRPTDTPPKPFGVSSVARTRLQFHMTSLFCPFCNKKRAFPLTDAKKSCII